MSCYPALLMVSVLLLVVTCPPLPADPCTLYKPADIDRARANIERYSWAKAIRDSLVARAESVLNYDDQFFYDLVPKLTPGAEFGQVCPACLGDKCSPGETGVFTWSISDPDHVKCRYCGTVYPNEQYPEEGTITAPWSGQTFTYYITPEERAHPEDTTGKYAWRWASWPIHVSWAGLVRFFKAAWLSHQVVPLAKAYVLTGEVKYAERCAVCLDALAIGYKGWLWHTYFGSVIDLPHDEVARSMGETGIGKFPLEAVINPIPSLRDRNGDGFGDTHVGFWGTGRFAAGAGGEGTFLLNCTVAYDLIRDATRADGTRVLTEEMERRIVDDLILAGCEDMEHYADINNKCGPGRALSGAVGQLFGRPASVRRAIEGFNRLMDEDFHFDGFCKESPSYSAMHLDGLQEIPDIVAGYSDPPDYQPEQGERITNLDPFEQMPRYRLALLSMVKMIMPNRRYPVIGDTHYTAGLSANWVEVLVARYGNQYAALLEAAQGAPLSEKGSEYALWHRPPDARAEDQAQLPLRTEYFPGWQVAVLRNGNPEGHTAFYFNGYAYHGHRHMDTLGIIYFAYGQELASDRGYIWDDPRNSWTKSTLAHNLVAVDGANQIGAGRHSTLELFATAPGLEVTQSSANAYEQCTQYRRTCALVALPDGGSYAADFFRVTGGKLHQYCFNVDTGDFTLTGASLELAPDQIKWLSNLRQCTPTGPWRATWNKQEVRMDLWMPCDLDRLVVADAPGWRSYKGTELHAPPIAQILAERRGEVLDSCFTAVMSPYPEDLRQVDWVQQIVPEDAEGQAVALVVHLQDGRTDYLISALDDELRRYGPVELAGRFGFVSLDAEGAVRAATLVDGTVLRCGETSLELAQPRLTRTVMAIRGRTITLDQPVEAGENLVGAYLLAGGTGYEIEQVQGTRITVREYDVQPCTEIIIPLVSSLVRDEG